MKLTLYHNKGAVCAQKVRLALAEKRLEWHPVEVDFTNAAFMEVYKRELNPLGVVPTLLAGSSIITESNVILEWLEEAYPQTKLMPADLIERARVRVWLAAIDIDIHTAINALSFAIVFRHQFLAMPPEKLEGMLAAVVGAEKRWRRRELVEHGLESRLAGFAVARFVQLFRDMEAALAGHNYLVGTGYTLADLALTPYLERLIELGFAPFLAQFPNLSQWWEHIVARENYARAILDFGGAAMRAEKAPAAAKAWPVIELLIKQAGST